MTGSADGVHGGADAPDEGQRPEEAEPQTRVNRIKASQMTAKGPKRPNRKPGSTALRRVK